MTSLSDSQPPRRLAGAGKPESGLVAHRPIDTAQLRDGSSWGFSNPAGQCRRRLASRKASRGPVPYPPSPHPRSGSATLQRASRPRPCLGIASAGRSHPRACDSSPGIEHAKAREFGSAWEARCLSCGPRDGPSRKLGPIEILRRRVCKNVNKILDARGRPSAASLEHRAQFVGTWRRGGVDGDGRAVCAFRELARRRRLAHAASSFQEQGRPSPPAALPLHEPVIRLRSEHSSPRARSAILRALH